MLEAVHPAKQFRLLRDLLTAQLARLCGSTDRGREQAERLLWNTRQEEILRALHNGGYLRLLAGSSRTSPERGPAGGRWGRVAGP